MAAKLKKGQAEIRLPSIIALVSNQGRLLASKLGSMAFIESMRSSMV